RLQCRQLVLNRFRLAFFEREQVCQFGDLPIEAPQRRVLAARLLGHEVLREHEDRQQEGENQKQRGEDVHVTWPELSILTAVATAPARHGLSSATFEAAGKLLQRVDELVLLGSLVIDPLTNDLLFRAHLRHELVYALG